jgi:hypothetical protein
MNIPTVKTMAIHFGIDKANALRSEFEHQRERDAHFMPLGGINRILNGYGVEYIDDRNRTIAYVNMGDSYATTILRVNGKIRVGDWGSIVER